MFFFYFVQTIVIKGESNLAEKLKSEMVHKVYFIRKQIIQKHNL